MTEISLPIPSPPACWLPPANLVSFCGDGVKSGPTTFEVRYRDYTPKRDLAVLILVRQARD